MMMIRAEDGGCGNIYTCKHMESKGRKVLLVCPTNRLAKDNKEHGCTLNKLFGIWLTEGANMAKLDNGGYDTVVFDEICFCSVRHLARVKWYCDNNPDKIVIATGDTKNLECIGCITNQRDYDEYYNKCVDLIFTGGMCFTENKRLKSKNDKDTLKRLKRDVFDDRNTVGNTIKKYCKTTTDINTTYNISDNNATCHNVSEEVRTRLLQKSEPYEKRGDARVQVMVQT